MALKVLLSPPLPEYLFELGVNEMLDPLRQYVIDDRNAIAFTVVCCTTRA